MLVTLGLLVGCAEGDGGDDISPDGMASEDAAQPEMDDEPEPPSEEDGEADDVDDGSTEPQGPEVDPASVEADELGVIPVLMYHQIREDGSEWDMTPDEFREELSRLFDRGFVPIRTKDLARGHIDVPAGRMPVVLTFDDSSRSQARFAEGGGWEPQTAIGILTEVAAAYDEVEPIGSFYLIGSSMFGAVDDSPDILRALHDAGNELGNHSHTHPNLRQLDAQDVQAELAQPVGAITEIVADAEVVTLSLPFGIGPEDRALAAAGEHDGISYAHEAVLLVGDRPSPSPFSSAFDPLAVPRIKTMSDPDEEFGSAWWLDLMESSEQWRPYVSDGDPESISFPRHREEELHPDLADRANPY